jgi:Family of unknown function (DUF6527)
VNGRALKLRLADDGWAEFDCPHCGERMAVPTRRGDGSAPRLWGRDSDDPATMTLTPSLDIQGHWHGHIRNGAAVSV